MNINRLSFMLLIIICVVLTGYIFYPGYMTGDAVDQLQQARSGLYNDWHPPVMAMVWRFLDRLMPGPFGMFMLQTVLFWGGLGICVSLVSSSYLSKSLYLLIGFYPPAFMLLSTVLKDVLMATTFLFGFSLILYSEKRKSVALFALGIIFISSGILLRHNAVLAALPLFLYSGIAFAKIYALKTGKTLSIWSSPVLGAILLIIVLALGSLWNNHLTKIKSYAFQQVMVHDLVGISLKTKTYLLPEYLASSEQPSWKDLRRLYQLRSLDSLYWPDFTFIHFKIIHDPVQIKDLINIWSRQIIEHPRAYLDHRLRVFTAILNINIGRTCYPYYYEETTYKPRGLYQDYGDEGYYSSNLIANRLFAWVEPLRNRFIYWNWLYVLSPFVIFVISLYRIQKMGSFEDRFPMITLALSVSALLYGLAYFFVATTCDFRMFYWNVIVTLVSPIFLIKSSIDKTGL